MKPPVRRLLRCGFTRAKPWKLPGAKWVEIWQGKKGCVSLSPGAGSLVGVGHRRDQGRQWGSLGWGPGIVKEHSEPLDSVPRWVTAWCCCWAWWDEQGPAGSTSCLGSYQVASVRGAGTLLGDTHAETGQAAIGVAGAQVEVVGPALAAGEAFYLGLGK